MHPLFSRLIPAIAVGDLECLLPARGRGGILHAPSPAGSPPTEHTYTLQLRVGKLVPCEHDV
eukprot:44862-Prymnesium_polylepis.1